MAKAVGAMVDDAGLDRAIEDDAAAVVGLGQADRLPPASA